MFSPIMRSKETDIVRDTKAIIETHVAAKTYYNCFWRINKDTKIRFYYRGGRNRLVVWVCRD